MANDGHIKGKQQHAEGQHGDKTHAAFIDSLQGDQGEASADDSVAQRGSPYGATPTDGKHRLSEEREQHDEAEKNSELRKTKGSDPAR
jgi:hypothetical protein